MYKERQKFFKRNQMSDEEEFIPYKSERKLADLFRTEALLNQNKKLQDKITSLIKETLKEARDEWCDMRATTLDAFIKVHQRTNARKGGIERDKNTNYLEKNLQKYKKNILLKQIKTGKN